MNTFYILVIEKIYSIILGIRDYINKPVQNGDINKYVNDFNKICQMWGHLVVITIVKTGYYHTEVRVGVDYIVSIEEVKNYSIERITKVFSNSDDLEEEVCSKGFLNKNPHILVRYNFYILPSQLPFVIVPPHPLTITG